MNSTKHQPTPVSSRASYLLAGVVAAVVALVIGLMIARGNTDPVTPVPVRDQGYGLVHNPAVRVTLESDGSQLLGLPGARTIIDVYEDPICPACGNLEHSFEQELARAVDGGTLAVRYHRLNFLDDTSASHDYSTRAGAALRCAATTGDGPAYAALHSALFTARQPSEHGRSDLSNRQLADIARDSRLPESAQRCIADGTDIAAASTAANTAKATLTTILSDRVSTPTVLRGTTKIDHTTPDWVHAATS